jgi:hypothetical protein
MKTDKFYPLYKGPEAQAKVQPSKLPYPVHKTCCTLSWPLWYLWITGPMSGQSDMLMQPHYFYILPMLSAIVYWTVGVLCGAESWSQWVNGAHEVLKTLAERENHQKWSQMVANGHKWSG